MSVRWAGSAEPGLDGGRRYHVRSPADWDRPVRSPAQRLARSANAALRIARRQFVTLAGASSR